MSKFHDDDDLELHIKARIAFDKAMKLKRINDEDAVLYWEGFVPQADIIQRFWPIFAPLFEQDKYKYKDVKAEVVYYTDYITYSTDVLNINKVIGTGISLKLITPSERIRIEKATEEAKEHFLNPEEVSNSPVASSDEK